MRTTWIVGLCMLFFIGTGISLTLEMQYAGTGVIDVFFALMKPDFSSFTNPLTAVGGFFIMVWDWIDAMWKVLWWDYSFFTGSWEILKYLGWCVSIGLIVSIVLAVRGTGST